MRKLAMTNILAASPSMGFGNQLIRWRSLFQSVGLDCSTSDLYVPEQQPGFDRLIIVPKGLAIKDMIEIMRTKFKVLTFTQDLSKEVAKNDRSNDESAYAIWIRDNIEADYEYKNMSANDVVKSKVVGMTLLERLLYELMYFTETGKYLDVGSYTLCTGSRYTDGNVPGVYWDLDGRGVYIDRCRPSSSSDNLRTRAVVS